MAETECSETSAYNIQTQGNYPEESIQQFLNTELNLFFTAVIYIRFYFTFAFV